MNPEIDPSVLELIRPHIFEKVGSRVTCNPIPEGADMDILVLVQDPLAFAIEADKAGFSYDGQYGPPEDLKETSFASFKCASLNRESVNLIVCKSKKFFDRFLAATHVAKRLNLLVKNDRIALFQAVLYAKQWNEEPEEMLLPELF